MMPTPHADLATLDGATLSGLLGIGRADAEAWLQGLLVRYLQVAAEGMVEIERAASMGRISAVADRAHSLKSSSRTVGALRLGQLLEDLERGIVEGSAADSGMLVAPLLDEFAAVRGAIEARIADSTGT